MLRSCARVLPPIYVHVHYKWSDSKVLGMRYAKKEYGGSRSPMWMIKTDGKKRKPNLGPPFYFGPPAEDSFLGALNHREQGKWWRNRTNLSPFAEAPLSGHVMTGIEDKDRYSQLPTLHFHSSMWCFFGRDIKKNDEQHGRSAIDYFCPTADRQY